MSDQLELFESPVVVDDLAIPDEISQHNGFTVSIYRPQRHHFKAWLCEVDEHLLDMTGYSVRQFANVPTFGGWHTWPSDTHDVPPSCKY